MNATFSIQALTVINNYFGDDPTQFCVQIQCEVVSPESPGGEAFSVTAISPAQLQRELEPEGIELGRGYILLLDYDQELIRCRMQKLLDGSRASTWDELHEYVERFFDWV